jgi:hypothetical protein
VTIGPTPAGRRSPGCSAGHQGRCRRRAQTSRSGCDQEFPAPRRGDRSEVPRRDSDSRARAERCLSDREGVSPAWLL